MRSLIDSDSDGLGDFEELMRGTNPILNDSDADGLTDGDEFSIYFTDLVVADTDGDGYDHGLEVVAGTDPLDDQDFPPPQVPSLAPGLRALLVLLMAGVSIRSIVHLGQV